MSILSLLTLALATGLTAAGPVSTRDNGAKDFSSVVNGFNNNNGFNWISGFNNFNQQEQVIQVQEESLKIVDNGRRREVVEQVQQVLIVDQVNNGFQKNLNNMFRKSNFNNRFQDRETVIIVVQEIQISIDDGRGNKFDESVFKQEIVVANRNRGGRRNQRSQTVMIFEEEILIARDILSNNAYNNLRNFDGIAGATDGFKNSLPTKTAEYQLFASKPTWSSIVADPAATLGSIWQNALQDMQANQYDGQDNALNAQLAGMQMMNQTAVANGTVHGNATRKA